MELSYFSINMLSYLVVDVSYMFSQEFTLELLLLLICFLVAAVAHLNTYSNGVRNTEHQQVAHSGNHNPLYKHSSGLSEEERRVYVQRRSSGVHVNAQA